jgi:hypothetical protein
MKFYIYWIITIGLAIWAILEKILAQIKGGNMGVFWILIALCIFFLAMTYDVYIQSTVNKRGRDNPF